MKYPKELLEEYVKKSNSVSHLMRQFGILPCGGSHNHISNKIKEYGIDTAHFYKSGVGGLNVPKNKLSGEKILIKRETGNKEKTKRLRRALIESGVEYKCQNCGIGPNWNKKTLVIQIDHIDGNWLNNRKENLRFLCPNCHSQTETFGLRRAIKTKICVHCGKLFEYTDGSRKFCSRHCSNNKRNKTIIHKIDWPKKDVLLKMLAKSNFTKLGKELGVSDNAIRKHLRKCDEST